MDIGELKLIRKSIRIIPDWPKKGIIFRDITPLFQDPNAFTCAIGCILETVRKFGKIDVVVAIEARGFILGAIIADRMGKSFVPIRKKASFLLKPKASPITLSTAQTPCKSTKMP